MLLFCIKIVFSILAQILCLYRILLRTYYRCIPSLRKVVVNFRSNPNERSKQILKNISIESCRILSILSVSQAIIFDKK